MSYRLSSRAVQDIADIYKYGIKVYGIENALRYLDDLENQLLVLSSKELDRDASQFAHNLKLYSFRAHVVFYVVDEDEEIYVIRVLGKRINFIDYL